jgi:rod shape determining protein RodA
MRRWLSVPIEWFVLLIPILLTISGIVTIYTITIAENGTRLAVSQLVFGLIGLMAMALLMFTDYRALRTYAWPLYALGIALLILLLPMVARHLPFAVSVFGATRWLDFGFFQLQPSEVFKLFGVIVGASILAPHVGNLGWKTIVFYVAAAAVPLAMVLAQPNLGTTTVLAVVYMGMFLAARPSRRLILGLLAVLAVAAPLLWFNLKPYQQSRIETFINPSSSDPQKQDYNVQQSLIAIGSGGLNGQGFGQGSQTVLNFLPVAHSDFIFAGWAEATGFIGSGAMLALYGVLIWRILGIARDADEPFAQLIAIGIAAKIFFQLVVHVGMNTRLLPVTGIPLPFMSYGGTALIIDLASIGLLQSIAIRHKKLVFHKG